MQRLTTQGDLPALGPAAPWASQTLFYPRWCFGEWQVTSTLQVFRAPLGERFVPSELLVAARAPAEQGGIGSNTRYLMHFYSTLPDTWENQLRVNFMGQAPVDAIIADRAFNTRELTNAMLGFEAVASVAYDTRDPSKETVEFTRVAPNGAQLPPKKSELFINRVQGELGEDVEGRPVFVTSECNRQVTLAVRAIDVSDYEVLTAYTLLRDGSIVAQQRTAVYLDPRQALYFQAANRAVALYDTQLRLERLPAPADAPAGAIACVDTPKGVAQCV